MPEILFERLAEAAVCLVPAWPLLRFLGRRRPGRSCASRLAHLAAGSLAFMAYAGVIVASAIHAPQILRGLALCAAAGTGLYLWWSGPGFGRRRGLPPGSLAPAPAGLTTDQSFFLNQHRRHGPVFKVLPKYRPTVCLVGHAAAQDFLKASAADLAAPPSLFNRHIPKGFLRYMDAAHHGDYRRRFQAALAPDLVASNDGPLRSLMRAAFERWDGPVDKEMTAVMFGVMARLFFGISASDPEFPRLRRAYGQIAVNDKSRAGGQAAERAIREIETLVADAALRCGAEGAPRTVLGTLVTREPAALDDPTVRRNLIYMAETAHRDVAGLMTWVMKILSENRPWVRRLRDQLAIGAPVPVDGKGRSLADRLILESLRLERSEYLFRRALREVRIGPFTIPKGWHVRVCIREGHRTNPAFERPEEFDPDRFLDRSFEPKDYAPFGLDHHRCLGQKIAADVTRLFLEELFGRFDFDVVTDGPVEFGGSHWQPGSAFRIRLTTPAQTETEAVAEPA